MAWMSGNLNSDDYAAFVVMMKAMRVEQGVTQAELASRLNQPQSYISKSERRERRIDVVEFIRITEALGLDPLEALKRVQRGL